MPLPTPFRDLSGEWKGVKRLFLEGALGPESTSGMRMTIAAAAKGCFDELAYTWSHAGKSCEGVMLIGYDESDGTVTGAWIDSFHSSTRVMPLRGAIPDPRTLEMAGAYPAPPGPDWGWRVQISVPKIQMPDLLLIRMQNVPPGGDDELAVVMELERV